MKFTCDSCGAAYMISDDKVGPNGVKVRCKKCGNVVTVRRAEEVPVLAPVAPAAPPAGLDDELGNAFDHAFGDSPTEPAAPAAEAPRGPAPVEPAAPPSSEWYVAIGEAQVGPLPLVEVRKKWEAGDIGPDSLVWRPGMADWGPLAGVPDLAAYLSPVPQPLKPSSAPATAVTSVAAPARATTPAAGVPAQPAPAPAASSLAEPEVTWKPAGANALAALASEEIATRDAVVSSTPKAPSGRSLVDQLPDSGGVDPTGSVPLSIKAMEPTDERPIRRTSVAKGAEVVRHKRTVRNVVMAVLAVALLAGGAAAAVLYLNGRLGPVAAVLPPPGPPARPAGAVVPPSPPPPPSPVEPAPPAPAAAAAGEPDKGPEKIDKAEPGALATKEPPPAAREPPPEKAVARPAPPRPPAPKPPPPKPAARPQVAKAEPPPPPPAPEKAAPPPKKAGSPLDIDGGGEDDLAAALGNGGGSGRSVYVPPKAGATAAPERLSDAQITESVKLHVDALRRCASEQQAREPGAKGTLKMGWTILPDGAPRDVRCLTPDLAASPFAQCITGVVKGIRFPRISDTRGQPVTFPFGY